MGNTNLVGGDIEKARALGGIAASLRAIPTQFAFTTQGMMWINAGTLAGELLLRAIDLGALGDPSYSALLAMTRLAQSGALAHQTLSPGSVSIDADGSVTRSPSKEWHAFTTAYGWLLTERGETIPERATCREFVEPACQELADLIEGVPAPPRMTACIRRARVSWEWVCKEKPELAPPDGSVAAYCKTQWEYVKEHGCPQYPDDDAGNPQLPGWESWSRYVRDYLRLTAEQADSGGRGRGGRSTVDIAGASTEG